MRNNFLCPLGIDFDWLHKRIYYTDYSLKTISSCYIDGTNITTLLSGLDKPRAIAVDPCRGKKCENSMFVQYFERFRGRVRFVPQGIYCQSTAWLHRNSRPPAVVLGTSVKNKSK